MEGNKGPQEINSRQDGSLASVNRHEQSPSSQSLPSFVIEPSRGWVLLQLGTLWEYRELFYFLVWRDIKVRYKQSVLGISWAILQPFTTMVVFSVFFGYLGQIPSDGIPYPIFTFAALLPWQLFANSLSAASHSLVMNQELITKVFFPRLIVPVSAVCVGLVDFGIAFVVLLGMMAYYSIVPTIAVITLPLFILLAIVTSLAVGLWLSALNVQYRDVQHIIPFLIQFWLFATPVAYPASIVPAKWQTLYGLNPMVGVVEGFRWALLGQARPIESAVAVSILVVIALLLSGLFYFKRMEKTFADVI
jgi:lipopolysaccharide transport system permease protein